MAQAKTKVFGLGLSRTGTTSLHAAAVILGYSAVHRPQLLAGRWMNADLSRQAAEPFDVYTDLPVPAYYMQFDRLFPDAKFILTHRDPSAWIESVERFFAQTAPSSSQTHRRDAIRLVVYGVVRFHKERFLDVYRRHNDSVLKHFRDRPSDFLAIDFGKEIDPWGRIANFLGQPAPKIRFPRLRSPAISDLDRVLPNEIATKRVRLIEMIESAGTSRSAPPMGK